MRSADQSGARDVDGAHGVDEHSVAPVGGAALLARVLAGSDAAGLTHVTELPARRAVEADWPDWVPPTVLAAFRDAGVVRPWSHQASAASLARAGRHVVLATGTASGKSLGYQLPVLSALVEDPRATALYLAPTKALCADQLRSVVSLGLADVRAAVLDGDTGPDERDWVRAHSRWVFSNPDMLHRSVLPRHRRWASFLRRLRYVVLDECHGYRGVFGSHVALLVRRLRRLCARYGSAPVFVLASATVSAPGGSASRLTGLEVQPVTVDGSPRGPRTIALWEPPLLPGPGERGRPGAAGAQADGSPAAGAQADGSPAAGAETPARPAPALRDAGADAAAGPATGENGAPVRRSAGSEAGRMLADLVVEGARTLAFVRSRRGAELTALRASALLAPVSRDLAGRVSAYRAGFLPEERRALEAALMSGELRGVATTNALELGVDIAGLDAVLVAGFPGTRASFWQQAGRAGRSSRPALVVLIARDDPLDTYLVHHPAALLGAPVEGCVLDPTNPYVLGPHLVCAAAEAPLLPSEVGPLFGPGTVDVLSSLVADGVLRRRSGGWFWPHLDTRPSASVDLRGGGGQVIVVEADTGRMLGTVDAARAPATVHPGAVYLHRGASFVVDVLDLPVAESPGEAGLALVHAEDPDWSTAARSVTDLAVVDEPSAPDHAVAPDHAPVQGRAPGPGASSGGVIVRSGAVSVTSRVVSYERRSLAGRLIETVPLDMPEQTLRTRAVWYSIDGSILIAAGLGPHRWPGSLHAAEHAAIGLLPLFALCDRWDIGGVSTALHPDTGRPTVFVYDGHPGGAGFAERGYAGIGPWLRATREAIVACECPTGCPSCVQSPKCGNGNDPLDKAGAVIVLDVVLHALAEVEAAATVEAGSTARVEAGGSATPAGRRGPGSSGVDPARGGCGADRKV